MKTCCSLYSQLYDDENLYVSYWFAQLFEAGTCRARLPASKRCVMEGFNEECQAHI